MKQVRIYCLRQNDIGRRGSTNEKCLLCVQYLNSRETIQYNLQVLVF